MAEPDDPVERLQQLWDEGQSPDLGVFVAAVGELSPERLAAVLRVDQRRRWRAGERIPAEDYLRRFPAVLEQTEATLDLIFNELLLREELGDPPAVLEYRRRFPRFASDLQAQWELHQALEPQTQAEPTPPVAPALRLDFLAPPRQAGELGWLGRYCVRAVLGQGGMGIVLHAWDSRLHRTVALKVLRPDWAKEPMPRERFEREARAVAGLKHEHIVDIFDVGEENGVPYLSMPLLSGESLEARLEREPRLVLSEVVRIARETASGLAAAHEQGIVHRDLKPGNLWLLSKAECETASPPVKLLDFGLARAVNAEVRLTQTGCILGTPAYMSPEQAHGQVVDARGDLFSLGSVLYRLCTGELPFPGTDPLSVLMAVTQQQPRPPHEVDPTIPRELSDLVMRLLAKAPEHRPPSARAVVAALREVEMTLHASSAPSSPRQPGSGSGNRRRRSRAITLAMLLLAGVLATTAVLHFRPTPPKDVDRAWYNEVAALLPEEQVAAVVARLKEHNPDFDGKVGREITQDKVVSLALLTDDVTDLSPVSALTQLRSLDCRGSHGQKGRLSNLAELKGLKLTSLDISGTQVSDLTPLRGMPLTRFVCIGTPVSELKPLQESPLTHLNCGDTLVSELSPLKSLKLSELAIDGTTVSDLSPLTDMKLTLLACTRTRVSNLATLKAMPLRTLTCDPQLARASPLLRAIPTLEQINGQAAEDFWKDAAVESPRHHR